MQIDAKVFGKDEMARKIRQFISSCKNMTDFYRAVGRHMRDETIRDRFENERAPDGTPWAPWSESYKRYLSRQLKGRKGKRSGKRGKLGNKILQDTGRLRRSIQYEARQDRAIVGTNVVYARAHQFGVPERHLPARPFLGINERDREWITRKIIGYLFSHT